MNRSSSSVHSAVGRVHGGLRCQYPGWSLALVALALGVSAGVDSARTSLVKVENPGGVTERFFVTKRTAL